MSTARQSRREKITGSKTTAASRRSTSPRSTRLDFDNKGLSWWTPEKGNELYSGGKTGTSSQGKFKVVEMLPTDTKSKSSAKVIQRLTSVTAKNKWWDKKKSDGGINPGNKNFVFHTHPKARIAGDASVVKAVIENYFDSKKKKSRADEDLRAELLDFERWGVVYKKEYDRYTSGFNSTKADLKKEANQGFKQAFESDPVVRREHGNLPEIYEGETTVAQAKKQAHIASLEKIQLLDGVNLKDVTFYYIKNGESVEASSGKKGKKKGTKTRKVSSFKFNADDSFEDRYTKVVEHNASDPDNLYFLDIKGFSDLSDSKKESFKPGKKAGGSGDLDKVSIAYISNFPVRSTDQDDYDAALEYLTKQGVVTKDENKRFRKRYQQQFEAIGERKEKSEKKKKEKDANKGKKGKREKKTEKKEKKKVESA